MGGKRKGEKNSQSRGKKLSLSARSSLKWLYHNHLSIDNMIICYLIVNNVTLYILIMSCWSSRKASILTLTLVILFPFLFSPKKREKKKSRMNQQKSWLKGMPFCSICLVHSNIVIYQHFVFVRNKIDEHYRTANLEYI